MREKGRERGKDQGPETGRGRERVAQGRDPVIPRRGVGGRGHGRDLVTVEGRGQGRETPKSLKSLDDALGPKF